MDETVSWCPVGHTFPTQLLRRGPNGLICPVCDPMFAAPPAKHPGRTGLGWAATVVPVLLAVAGVVTAAFLAFTPLPTQSGPLGTTGWCGPGYRSESAVSVLLDPASVNEGGPQDDDFQNLCVGVASTRLHWSAAWLVAGVVVGLVGVIPSRARTPFLYD